ncbi:probable mediator of RNA polymerase II transcription subunit 26c [Miscanthus floridulus]|uniref:probable mediator of RNA polymerase II transcription subunit 26c n=1 Tax=Miscanthus floridulus TaxID=154761 RepID=UPI0034598C99
MANEESGSPLRRWRPFYSTFGAIDEAIEAAGHPRAAFREVRVRIVQLLRGAVHDGVAEQLCAALDDTMVEALDTLRVAPVPHSALASTDLARAVGALGKHGSARIRTLADDVVRGWSTAIDGATATAEKELDKLSDDRIPRQVISTAVKKPVDAESKKTEAKKPIVTHSEKIEAKKPVAAQSEKMETKKLIVTHSEKMENTKRKLREGYEEAKKIKRLHTIQKIEDKEAPKLLEQSQRKMHRVPARCRTSSGVRRSLLPSLQLI